MCVDCVEAYVPLRPPSSNAPVRLKPELTPAHQLLYHAEEIPRELAACTTRKRFLEIAGWIGLVMEIAN